MMIRCSSLKDFITGDETWISTITLKPKYSLLLESIHRKISMLIIQKRASLSVSWQSFDVSTNRNQKIIYQIFLLNNETKCISLNSMNPKNRCARSYIIFLAHPFPPTSHIHTHRNNINLLFPFCVTYCGRPLSASHFV